MALYDTPMSSEERLRAGSASSLLSQTSPYDQKTNMGSGSLSTGFIGGSLDPATGNLIKGTREGIKQGNTPTPFGFPPSSPLSEATPPPPATTPPPITSAPPPAVTAAPPPAAPALAAAPPPFTPTAGAAVQAGEPAAAPGFKQFSDPNAAAPGVAPIPGQSFYQPPRWGEDYGTPAPPPTLAPMAAPGAIPIPGQAFYQAPRSPLSSTSV
jgi:hypothetical protein